MGRRKSVDNLDEKYVDFLIATNKSASGKAFSRLFDGKIFHDQVTRLLQTDTFSPASLWKVVKPLCTELAYTENVLIADDSLIAKPDTAENEVVMYHWDHVSGRHVKGICMVTMLYNAGLMNIPVSIEVVKKTEGGKSNKHLIFQEMLKRCVYNGLTFKYVLADKWYASVENMEFITDKCGKDFIFPLKANRRVKLEGSRFYSAISDLELEEGKVYAATLQGYARQVYIARYEVKDGSDKPSVLYLVTSDGKPDWKLLLTCYQKRWQVELFHRSVKQNAAIGKAPLRTARSLISHCYAAIHAFVKLELLKIRHALPHDSIKELIRYVSNKASYNALQNLSTLKSTAYKQLNLFA